MLFYKHKMFSSFLCAFLWRFIQKHVSLNDISYWHMSKLREKVYLNLNYLVDPQKVFLTFLGAGQMCWAHLSQTVRSFVKKVIAANTQIRLKAYKAFAWASFGRRFSQQNFCKWLRAGFHSVPGALHFICNHSHVLLNCINNFKSTQMPRYRSA